MCASAVEDVSSVEWRVCVCASAAEDVCSVASATEDVYLNVIGPPSTPPHPMYETLRLWDGKRSASKHM